MHVRSLNRVELIGRVGNEPEVKTPKEKKVADIRLATHEGYFGKDSEWVDVDVWHNIVCWNAIAEKTEKINKGDLVHVTGRITYKEKETVITADEIILLSKPKRE